MIRTLAALFLFPATVFAQTCEHRDLIVSNAEKVLELRPKLSSFKSKHFGAEAAYFLIHYAPLNYASAQSLLRPLIVNKVHDADDLAVAHAISNVGIDEGISVISSDRNEALQNMRHASVRALLLADSGKRYLELRSELNPIYNGTFQLTATLLVDQTDEFKRNLADLAEEAGDLVLASHLLANLADSDALADLYDRHSKDSLADIIAPYLLGLDNRPIEKTDGRLSKAREILSAMKLTDHAVALNIYYNLTGREEPVLAAIHKLESALAAAELHQTDSDAAWLLMVDTLIEIEGHDFVATALSSFDMPSIDVIEGGNRMSAITDRLRALQALQPVMRGETRSPPEQPRWLGTMDWDTWVEIAQTLAQGNKPDVLNDPTRSAIAVALLRKGGRYKEASDLASNMPLKERLYALKRLLRTLDDECDRHGHYSHQNFIGPSRILYRFDAKN